MHAHHLFHLSLDPDPSNERTGELLVGGLSPSPPRSCLTLRIAVLRDMPACSAVRTPRAALASRPRHGEPWDDNVSPWAKPQRCWGAWTLAWEGNKQCGEDACGFHDFTVARRQK